MVIKFLILVCLLFSCSFGAKSVAGQKYYLKQCSTCHGKGNRGGGLASGDEWKTYFSNGAKDMILFHEDELEVLKYLKSEKFKNQQKKMLKFLLEFANDSDNIPSCNN